MECWLAIVVGLSQIRFAEPIVGLGLADVDVGVGESEFAIVNQAAEVVAVQVGEQDAIHLLRRIAGGFEVIHHLADGRIALPAIAGIHQNQVFPVLIR